MTDRIRIIPHALRSIPDSGSFEVWFADGRESQYFYWDDNPGRASTTTRMNQSQAKEAASALARAERAKLEHTCSLATAGDGFARNAATNLTAFKRGDRVKLSELGASGVMLAEPRLIIAAAVQPL